MSLPTKIVPSRNPQRFGTNRNPTWPHWLEAQRHGSGLMSMFEGFFPGTGNSHLWNWIHQLSFNGSLVLPDTFPGKWFLSFGVLTSVPKQFLSHVHGLVKIMICFQGQGECPCFGEANLSMAIFHFRGCFPFWGRPSWYFSTWFNHKGIFNIPARNPNSKRRFP